MPDAQGRLLLGDLAGPRTIEVYCRRCVRRVLLDPAGLMVAHGEETPWSDVRGRLRCRHCRGRWPGGLTVQLIEDHPPPSPIPKDRKWWPED